MREERETQKEIDKLRMGREYGLLILNSPAIIENLPFPVSEGYS